MDESRVENLARASSENGTATVIGLNWARNVVQVSAAVSGEERCVTRQITAAWETSVASVSVSFFVVGPRGHWDESKKAKEAGEGRGGPFRARPKLRKSYFWRRTPRKRLLRRLDKLASSTK